MEQLDQRISAAAEHGKALLAAVRDKVDGLNLTAGQVAIPQFDEVQFSLEKDLYDDTLQTLVASYYPRPNYRSGVLLFHADGSCFAEFHVMQVHPARPKWFIESVEAWVRDGAVQTDLRLVAMPE
jgi:hypothetical protein